MKVTLLIPTLNEIEGLNAIMPKIDHDWVDQIIILDGGSTDGTQQWARARGYLNVEGHEEWAKELKYLLYVQKEPGLKQAYKEVWPYINGGYVITFSPDGNSDPAVIPELIAKIKEGCYAMVIVSRYLGNAWSEDDTWITGFGNWFFTTLINICHGGREKFTDAMVMFRAYRVELVDSLRLTSDEYNGIEELLHTRVSFEPLLSIRALKYNLWVSEIPGNEPARIGGKAKLQIVRWGLVFLYQVIREIFRKP